MKKILSIVLLLSSQFVFANDWELIPGTGFSVFGYEKHIYDLTVSGDYLFVSTYSLELENDEYKRKDRSLVRINLNNYTQKTMNLPTDNSYGINLLGDQDVVSIGSNILYTLNGRLFKTIA